MLGSGEVGGERGDRGKGLLTLGQSTGLRPAILGNRVHGGWSRVLEGAVCTTRRRRKEMKGETGVD